MPSLLPNPEFENPLVNVESEQAVLGAFLTWKDAFVHHGNLQTQHFSEPLHQRIFEAMQTQWQAGNNFNPVTLRPQFENDPALVDIGGAKYLMTLAAHSVAVVDVADHIDLLVDLFQRRALLEVCTDAMVAIQIPGNQPPVELAADFSVKLSEAATGLSTNLFRTRRQVREAIVQGMGRERKIYSTGIALLDKAMRGGLYAGKSYGFAARKKMGKTILAGTISDHLGKRDIPHLLICGEMSDEEIEERLMAHDLSVTAEKFSEKYDTEFAGRAARNAIESSDAVITLPAPGITFSALKRYVLMARMQKRITGFILDYWQLVGGKPKGKTTAEHLDEVAQWVADACRKYDLWSITMAQINQEGNTRGGEGIRLAFDQVYTLNAPDDDAARSERWLEMADTRYTAWRSVGSASKPAFYLNPHGPYFSETYDDNQEPLPL